ncbi:MAG: histidine phosphatase family protein [Candidatus Eisenbacteria bacterium]|nr:histidine phosphatase family protein [Candidatus Eisenbacteria bacterium]
MHPDPIHLLLARHGQTDWNRVHRLQGRTDVPLNDEGRRQAAALAGSLETERVDAARVSPLQRARQTAAAIEALRADVRFTEEPRLAEIHMGRWEGVLEADLAADPAYSAWRTDPVRANCPGGEGALDVARRVAPLLDELAALSPGTRVLLLGHQFTNAVILCLVGGIPLDAVRTQLAAPGEFRRTVLAHRGG